MDLPQVDFDAVWPRLSERARLEINSVALAIQLDKATAEIEALKAELEAGRDDAS